MELRYKMRPFPPFLLFFLNLPHLVTQFFWIDHTKITQVTNRHSAASSSSSLPTLKTLITSYLATMPSSIVVRSPIVLRVRSGLPLPTPLCSMPSYIEHVPCSLRLTKAGHVAFSLLPCRHGRSLIPLPTKPARKMPSSIFHFYRTTGGPSTPQAVLRKAEALIQRAMSTFDALAEAKVDIPGRKLNNSSQLALVSLLISQQSPTHPR